MRQSLNETNICYMTYGEVDSVLFQVQSRICSTFRSGLIFTTGQSIKITVMNSVWQSTEAMLLYPQNTSTANAVEDYFKTKCTNH